MKTETVLLHVKTKTGVDGMNNPVYDDSTVEVSGVLIGQPTTEEVTSSIALYGKRLSFVLALPKGDTHDWSDTEVEFWGRKFRTYGDVIEGIEENVPTPWHRKVMVERFG